MTPPSPLPENLVRLLGDYADEVRDASDYEFVHETDRSSSKISKALAALEAGIRAYGERAPSEEVRERDRLFCKALIGSGLDPREMSKVLRAFNELRPDRDDDFLKQMREFDAHCAATLAALGAPERKEP